MLTAILILNVITLLLVIWFRCRTKADLLCVDVFGIVTQKTLLDLARRSLSVEEFESLQQKRDDEYQENIQRVVTSRQAPF